MEPAAGGVEELPPFLGGGMAHELEHEGAARADVGPPREEVAADERLQHAGLAAALPADRRYLRQLQAGGGVAVQPRDDILQAVN